MPADRDFSPLFRKLGATTAIAAAALAATMLSMANGCSGGSSGNNNIMTGAGGAIASGNGGKLMGTGGKAMGAGGMDAGLAACLVAPFTRVYAFGTSFDNWGVAGNSSMEVAPMMGVDGSPDTGSTIELDKTDGSPTLGSVKITIPFTGPGQTMLFARQITGNLAGTTVSAKVKLQSGIITGPTDTVSAFIALKSGSSYVYAMGSDMTLDSGEGWQTITASADIPSAPLYPGYTSCDIREIDIVVQTGNAGHYQTGVVSIDSITISAPGVNPDGGDETDGATDAAGDGGAPPDAQDDGASNGDSSTPDDGGSPSDGAPGN